MTKDMIIHHIKYKEIHGYDETVLMTKSDHKKLHMRLRKEGKCNIPSEELKRISNKAASRSHVKERKLYRDNNKEEIAKYQKRYNEVKDKTLTAAKKKKYDEDHKKELKNYRRSMVEEKHVYDQKRYQENKEEILRRKREAYHKKKMGVL